MKQSASNKRSHCYFGVDVTSKSSLISISGLDISSSSVCLEKDGYWYALQSVCCVWFVHRSACESWIIPPAQSFISGIWENLLWEGNKKLRLSDLVLADISPNKVGRSRHKKPPRSENSPFMLQLCRQNTNAKFFLSPRVHPPVP